jgi:hypothetical protein
VQCLDEDKGLIKSGLLALSDPSTAASQAMLTTLGESMPITAFTGEIGLALSVPSRQQGQPGGSGGEAPIRHDGMGPGGGRAVHRSGWVPCVSQWGRHPLALAHAAVCVL